MVMLFLPPPQPFQTACVNLSDKFKETAEFNSIDAQLKSMVLRVQEVETSTERTTRKTGFYATSPFWQVL